MVWFGPEVLVVDIKWIIMIIIGGIRICTATFVVVHSE